MQKSIQEKLKAKFQPEHLEVENESHQHSVPANSETHFKVLLVTPAFQGLARIERSRQLHAALDHELKNGVHALTSRLLTPEEFKAGQGDGFISPACHGGSQREK